MTILFIHGLASSGAYKMSGTLRILLKGSTVVAPDVPIDPDEALQLLRGICTESRPDAVVGLSMGGFWAQKLRGIPKLLVNPDFHISRLMRSKTGQVEYLSPRADGERYFTITPELCDRYERLESSQFDGIDEAERALTRGAFADKDELVSGGADEFSRHYPGCARIYPGGHLPDFPQVKKYLLPILEEMLKPNNI